MYLTTIKLFFRNFIFSFLSVFIFFKIPTLNYNVKFIFFLKNKNFQFTFQDSGLWDFIILYTYDYYLRLYLIYSLVYFSEYALVEKASWRLFNFVYYPITNLIYFENLNFFFLIKFILLIFIIFLNFYFYFSFFI